jgi:DNA-binding NarL/FixJ family response regulator
MNTMPPRSQAGDTQARSRRRRCSWPKYSRRSSSTASTPRAARAASSRFAPARRTWAEASSNKQIAARLRISPRTAEKHIESLLRKTSAGSRTELAVIASPRPRRPHRSLRGLPDVLACGPPARW